MFPHFKAIIFDLDGTLIDSLDLWQELDFAFLKKRGLEVPPDLFFDLQSTGYKETAQYFKDRFLLPDSVEDIMQEWTAMIRPSYENFLTLRKGCYEFLTYLHQHQYLLALGTNNSVSLAQAVLQSNHIEHYFTALEGGCSNLRGKPAPDIYLKIAQKLHVLPSSCLVVEDSLSGCTAAVRAKMTVWAIAEKHSKHNESKIRHLAQFFFQNYENVLDIFQGL